MSQKIDFAIASPEGIESALGARLEALRLSRNINQSALAAEAGVSRRTITRLENGEGMSLNTLIRIMQALGIADRLETLLPDPAVRPVERVRLKGRERRRARMKKGGDDTAWSWDTDMEPDQQ